jgi:hypothetical protein
LRFAIAAQSARLLDVSPDEKLQLLGQFAPALHFDALERWRPGPVDRYLEHCTVLDEQEQPLSGTPPAEAAMKEHGGKPKARLNPLVDGPGLDDQLRSNEVLSAFGADQGLAGGGTAYGRVEPEGGGFFLQYWLFYADNPCVLPPGRHDGDWELVQVRIERTDDGFVATQVTLAEHGKPVTKKVEAAVSKRGPKVFVAVDSHACYFKSGAQPMLPLSDTCQPVEADGVKPDIVLFPLAEDDKDWAHWSGRWGMDGAEGTRVALRLGLKNTPPILRRLNFGAGESPPSPGLQNSWPSPEAFAGSGTRRKRFTVALRQFAHFLGRLTWPREAPVVSIERINKGRYAIEAKPAGRLLRRIARVSVAFDEVTADENLRALAMYSVRTRDPAEVFKVPHEGELIWRAAGYNVLRQRGNPVDPTQ